MRRSTAAGVFGCASVLLSYPDEGFGDDLAAVADALGHLPKSATRERLMRTTTWLIDQEPLARAASYVETFDLRSRRNLHLTYYRHGDTRERGMALTALVDAYRSVGLRVAPGELPDFLPALLELAAVHSGGAAVLSEHRAALEALHDDLKLVKSPYADVISAVTDALGGLSQDDRKMLARYRAQGPPSEQVGLEPFAPPEVIAQGVTIGATRR
ncbi:MAG TPA: nitrate reductase molybdenum cofactor assembly chaperone [Acidimicrobiales bacterium]|nr:nitrate reductase molybdenum cofactor assembly chaperone [Acidimicrobiales bacterium]